MMRSNEMALNAFPLAVHTVESMSSHTANEKYAETLRFIDEL